METVNLTPPEADNENRLQEIEEAIHADLQEPIKLNRKQRRSIMHKMGKKRGRTAIESVAETATKLNYIHMIEKLRELNEQKEKELKEYADASEEE